MSEIDYSSTAEKLLSQGLEQSIDDNLNILLASGDSDNATKLLTGKIVGSQFSRFLGFHSSFMTPYDVSMSQQLKDFDHAKVFLRGGAVIYVAAVDWDNTKMAKYAKTIHDNQMNTEVLSKKHYVDNQELFFEVVDVAQDII